MCWGKYDLYEEHEQEASERKALEPEEEASEREPAVREEKELTPAGVA